MVIGYLLTLVGTEITEFVFEPRGNGSCSISNGRTSTSTTRRTMKGVAFARLS